MFDFSSHASSIADVPSKGKHPPAPSPLSRQKIVFASHNAGKLREVAAFLAHNTAELVSLATLGLSGAEETGLSFVENALIKARDAAQKTQWPALADDSGLVVDALGGAPGIYSARYAGHHATDAENVQQLLKALESIPFAQRTARFHCALVLMRTPNDPMPLICEGTWEGIIAEAPSGEGGFGYDPVFFLPEYQKTAATLDVALKNQLSHRGQALRELQVRFDILPALKDGDSSITSD